jgi:hypothetical protein
MRRFPAPPADRCHAVSRVSTSQAVSPRSQRTTRLARDISPRIRLVVAKSPETRRKARRWSRSSPSPLLPHRRACHGVGAFDLMLPENDSKMSGAGFDSSTSSAAVFRSTKSVMRAMSRYLSTSSFLAEEATAIRSAASRAERVNDYETAAFCI